MNALHSHPDKLLSDHTKGVHERVRRLSTLPIAHAAALFHDFGKVNPNFQKKLRGQRHVGYSHHAYLSAFLWLTFLYQNKDIQEKLQLRSGLDIVAVTALIAKHHGDLPDLQRGVFERAEAERLRSFLDNNSTLPLDGLLPILTQFGKISISLPHGDIKDSVIEGMVGLGFDNPEPLRFFLEMHQAFASLVNADKQDASGYSSDDHAVARFCSEYNRKLNMYLATLSQYSEINRVRMELRQQAIGALSKHLNSDQRTFALTAPTGSGKTLMLLSLAGKIIEKKGAYRIIYSLPFLSITEQVFTVCSTIFGEEVRRIDSRAENIAFGSFQEQLDDDPEAFTRLLQSQYAEDTFDFPFIVTTFVRFFETLLSNRNSTLLKLPNFSRGVFLIDEIQALPPRLYTFFVALLDAFCRMFDSYAIISSATMPDFRLPANDSSLSTFFNGYAAPPELLPTTCFSLPQFDRYMVDAKEGSFSIELLAHHVAQEETSVLVVLNTIDDTKALCRYLSRELGFKNVILLNTHFTPDDRMRKLSVARHAVQRGVRVIVVSTQLVEAGVDIDFPVVYRDLAPFPNIVQSAGRCNRNNTSASRGRLVLFELEREGRKRWNLVYKGPDARLVKPISEFSSGIQLKETELYDIQRKYFEAIGRDLLFGYHKSSAFDPNGEIYFVERIRQAAFAEVGKFQLIDETEFGKELRYYVPNSEQDTSFQRLSSLVEGLAGIATHDHNARRVQLLKVDAQLRAMAGRVVQIRVKHNESPPLSEGDECCGLRQLRAGNYDYSCGIRLDSSNQII